MHDEIIVLGMHRSGSSLTTEILTQLGCCFGSLDKSIGANSENPRGFWERRDVRDCNDAILNSHESEWNAVSRYFCKPPATETKAELERSCASALREIRSEGSLPIVIKEPRMCLTLPYWLGACNSPKIIFIHRDPMEIAVSLKKRNGMELEYSLDLWERYVGMALAQSVDLPIHFVDYKQLLESPVDEIRRMDIFINDSSSEERVFNAAKVIDVSLRRSSSALLDPDALLTKSQKELVRCLDKLVNNSQAQVDFSFATKLWGRDCEFENEERNILLQNYINERRKSASLTASLAKQRLANLTLRESVDKREEFIAKLKDNKLKTNELLERLRAKIDLKETDIKAHAALIKELRVKIADRDDVIRAQRARADNKT
ncbi:sulfotransferase [uncultured Umboniibacter sp.]|uniref:sulfotransferase n=1 Tax=uncultured Umboniibacter sp. TaxID=1798917 RepID=UPI0026237BD6|nr:sulfotransferase [uncultured Umboniibacter sp.]